MNLTILIPIKRTMAIREWRWLWSLQEGLSAPTKPTLVKLIAQTFKDKGKRQKDTHTNYLKKKI